MISFLVFSARMARDIRSKKPVPAKPWKKLISAEKSLNSQVTINWCEAVRTRMCHVLIDGVKIMF